MQKKLVQSSLALAAATALGLGGAFVAGPAAADSGPQKLDVQSQTKVQDALSSIDDINAYGVKGDTLNIGVGDPESKDVKALAAEYDNVNVLASATDIKPQAKNDLVGGAGYLATSDSGLGACSTGFAGWNSKGESVVVTAGHCAQEIVEETGEVIGKSTVNESEKPATAPANGGEGFDPSGLGVIGKWAYENYGQGERLPDDATPKTNPPKDSDIDFAAIKVDGSKYQSKSGVTDWKKSAADAGDLSSSTTEIKSIGKVTDGDIEKSGRTTGKTSGEVFTEYNDAFQFQNVGGYWVHGFGVTAPLSDPFSQPGDSGGGVYQGSKAVGVISGGGTYQDTKSFAWVADLDYSLEYSDVDFSLSDPSEEPEAPAAPSVEDQTIEPKGEITGKAAAGADVKVTWTGAAEGEVTAKADDSGNFTLEGPTAEGDYDAKAVATVEGQSSEAASFKVTVKAADGSDDKDGSSSAAADGNDSDENADKDGNSSAEGNDADEDSKDDADKNGGSAADGKDSDGSDNADGNDDKADSDADGNEKPEAPKVGDQTVVEGGKITGQAEPNAEVKLTWAPADANAGSSQAKAQAAPAKGSATVKTDADGKFTADAPAEAGDYNYTAVVHANGQDSAATEFVVTVEAEEAPAERKLTVDPKEVTASDFVDKEKGVQITGEGFDEGEKVSLKVASGPENVEGITLEETANADGVVGFSIYGTSASNPEAYLGKYDVEVTGANDTEDESALTGSFEVVADEDGSGGGDNGDGNDDGNGGGGSDLPRTGAELTGLAAGAGLLLVGGAAVVLTMRRKKNN
ncbi:S1 family peptidase [Brevibacterium oceani]|uniref:S1 family peptidase n=1 Tax=Brevibacterium oceani TaxID=358099 RepID=UPI001FE3CDDA|nr:S1 family peptidase [Brevibacterium oceani]